MDEKKVKLKVKLKEAWETIKTLKGKKWWIIAIVVVIYIIAFFLIDLPNWLDVGEIVKFVIN